MRTRLTILLAFPAVLACQEREPTAPEMAATHAVVANDADVADLEAEVSSDAEIAVTALDPIPNPGTCPAGYYEVFSVLCVPAPAGSYAPPGASAPIPCPVGTYQPAEGQEACIPAPAGGFVSTTGQMSFTLCSPGTYQPAPGQAGCLPAPPGTFAPSPGTASPITCPAGTFSTGGAIQCSPVPPGTFSGPGASVPTPCPAGTFSITPGSSSCTPAPAGRYVPNTGATQPLLCPLGKYQPNPGQTSCINAPIGAYVDVQGATAPTPCPAGLTTLTFGSTSASACVSTFSFDWDGFFAPVANEVVNLVKAGRAIPIKFSLGGDQGLDIFESGHPASQPVTCDAMAVLDAVAATETAGGSGLSYDASTHTYTYVWKTDRKWAGTCRVLVVRLTDGSEHTATFNFEK